MARSTLFRFVAVLICVAFVGVMVGLAVEGTVKSYEKGKLVVTVGGKDEEIATKGVTIKGKDGNGQAQAVKKIRKQALPDVGALKFLLTNRAPDRWRESKSIDHGGQGGGPIEIRITPGYNPDDYPRPNQLNTSM